MMPAMREGVFRRLGEWVQDWLRREKVPEFRTREDYERWKAAQHPQPAAPSAEAVPSSIEAPPKSKQEVHQGPPICPYCGESFPSFPKRKRKCPSCENVVVIWRGRRRTQRELVTEARAARLAIEEEEERAKIAAQAATEEPERRVRRLARTLQCLGISEVEIRHQVSVSASEGDAVWALLNLAAQRLMAEGDFETLSNAYWEMALQLDRENRDFSAQLREAARMKLLAIQQLERESPGIVSGVSISSGGGCEACERLDGSRFSLADAIRLQPLPCPDCTFTLKSGRPGWCRCLYLVDTK